MLPCEDQLAADEAVKYDEKGEDYDDDEEDDVDEGQEGPKLERTHAGKEETIPLVLPPFHPPFPHKTSGSSSSAVYMRLDPTFLQSLSALQMEVLSFQEGYTGMCDNLHHFSRWMEVIDAGVTYFWDCQEKRERR